jgi:pimeloyl-ACP methyl ester carboxylesterase
MPLIAANGIEICYEDHGDKDAEPLLLIMGIGTQLIHWPDELVALFVERGFRVIRFDNRDMGLSTKLDHLGSPRLGPMTLRAMFKLRVDPPYRLNDMADDTAGLLDALGIESAHLLGVSMGGMIAQTVAIRHPTRVRSLTSLMSTTGERFFGKAKAYRALFGRYPADRAGAIERSVRIFSVLTGPAYPLDEAACRELTNRVLDRAPANPAAFRRQFAAILGSGNRVKLLRRLDVPTLVIHGTADPLIPIAAGEATARAIPGARLERIEGMGHQMPAAFWPVLADAVAEHALEKAA